MTLNDKALPDCCLLLGGEWMTSDDHGEVLDKYRLAPCVRPVRTSAAPSSSAPPP